MRIGIYPGSFDPITLGHLNIIERSANIVDKLIVAVLNNINKVPCFTVEERLNMIKNVTANYENVEVDCFDGLLVDYAKNKNANVIIRGLRAVSDFEYEVQMAQTNKALNNEIETIFLFTDAKYSYLSASGVREIAKHSGSIEKFVTPYVASKLREKFG